MSTIMGSGGYSTSIPTPVISALSALDTSVIDGIGNISNDTWSIVNSTGVENRDWILVVDTVILVSGCKSENVRSLISQALTILGSLMILISMGILEWRGRPSTTRMRLVQSLVLSDLALG